MQITHTHTRFDMTMMSVRVHSTTQTRCCLSYFSASYMYILKIINAWPVQKKRTAEWMAAERRNDEMIKMKQLLAVTIWWMSLSCNEPATMSLSTSTTQLTIIPIKKCNEKISIVCERKRSEALLTEIEFYAFIHTSTHDVYIGVSTVVLTRFCIKYLMIMMQR